jgi:hypothetical protein
VISPSLVEVSSTSPGQGGLSALKKSKMTRVHEIKAGNNDDPERLDEIPVKTIQTKVNNKPAVPVRVHVHRRVQSLGRSPQNNLADRPTSSHQVHPPSHADTGERAGCPRAGLCAAGARRLGAVRIANPNTLTLTPTLILT